MVLGKHCAVFHDNMLIRAGRYTFSLRSSSSTIKTKLSNKFRTSPGIVVVYATQAFVCYLGWLRSWLLTSALGCYK